MRMRTAAFFAVLAGSASAFEPLGLRGGQGFEEIRRAAPSRPARAAAPVVVVVPAAPPRAERQQSNIRSVPDEAVRAAGAARAQGAPASQPAPQAAAAARPATLTAESAPAVPRPDARTPKPSPAPDWAQANRLAVALPPQPQPPRIEAAPKPAAPPAAIALVPAPPIPAPRAAAQPAMPQIRVSVAAVPHVSIPPASALSVAAAPPSAAAPPQDVRAPVRVASAPDAAPAAPAPAAAPPPKDALPHGDADWRRRLAQVLQDIDPTLVPQGALPEIRRFYAQRGMRPLLTDGEALTSAGQAVLRIAGEAHTHGLDPRRFARLTGAAAGTLPSVQREVALAGLAIAYARDARGARVSPQAISRLILLRPSVPQGDEVLAALANARDPGAALEGFNPPHAGYAALRAQLKLARHSSLATAAAAPRPPEMPVILHGPELATGMTDSRVPLLRQRLGIAPADDLIYDEDLSEEIVNTQRYHGLRPHGLLDHATIEALNATRVQPAEHRDAVADIIANMERWRWLPADLGETHVLVNIPSFMLRMQRGGATALTARVIVGEVKTPTPQMSNRIDHMVINPSWIVPPNIARREYLPMLKEDPDQLDDEGIQVHRTRDGIRFYQPPGDNNGLGRIKIVFPNQFTVHLHDTPERALFDQPRRAESNGCVRVQDPFALAEAVLGGAHTRAELMAMIGPRERRIEAPRKTPVHLVYFTYEAAADGTLAVHEDVYGHDAKLRALLGT